MAGTLRFGKVSDRSQGLRSETSPNEWGNFARRLGGTLRFGKVSDRSRGRS